MAEGNSNKSQKFFKRIFIPLITLATLVTALYVVNSVCYGDADKKTDDVTEIFNPEVPGKVKDYNQDVSDKVIEKEGLIQVSDRQELQTFVEEAIKNNPKPVNEFLSGKDQAVMFLVGQIMKKSKGKANPKIVREMLERRLKR